MQKWMILLLCTLLSGCGFHLQGEKQLAKPLRKMYLQTPDPYGYLARNLQQSLKMSHVQLVSSPEQADTILAIDQDLNSQIFLSSSGTNQTRQYNLKVTVIFSILDSKGRVLLPPQTLEETRTITVQSNRILGSSNEATLFYQQMRRSLAYAIMNRIASKEVTRQVTNGPVVPVVPKAASTTENQPFNADSVPTT